jgi:hypothetical protein
MFFIGGAAEWLIEQTGTTTLAAIVDANKWADAQRSRKTEDKVRAVIEALRKSGKVDASEVNWLEAQATLYRLDRNEIGHPRTSPPQVPRHGSRAASALSETASLECRPGRSSLRPSRLTRSALGRGSSLSP